MSHHDCEHQKRKPKDGKCSEKQIRRCHGEKEKHPCDSEKEE